LKTKNVKSGKVKQSGKIVVKKWLITVDSSEENPEDITHMQN
jgi:hypothetical protein